jgi:hypothetical protein
MTKHSFQNTIDALPVFDTHTHLNGASLPAQIKRLLEIFYTSRSNRAGSTRREP